MTARTDGTPYTPQERNLAIKALDAVRADDRRAAREELADRGVTPEEVLDATGERWS